MRWKFAMVCVAAALSASLVGAGGVYLYLRVLPGAAPAAPDAVTTSAPVPASDAPPMVVNGPASASDVQAASTPEVHAQPGTADSSNPAGPTLVAASGVTTATAPVGAASSPAPVPAVARTALDAVASATGGSVAGKIDVPRMAQDLGPFSSRLRSIACEPLHGDSPTSDRPTWRCVVTLNGSTVLFPVRSYGPHTSASTYTVPLFLSAYAFVYVAAHDGKAAHYSAMIDPKAAPYPATLAWTSQVIVQAVELAIRAETMTAEAAAASAALADPVGTRNAESWAKVGLKR